MFTLFTVFSLIFSLLALIVSILVWKHTSHKLAEHQNQIAMMAGWHRSILSVEQDNSARMYAMQRYLGIKLGSDGSYEKRPVTKKKPAKKKTSKK